MLTLAIKFKMFLYFIILIFFVLNGVYFETNEKIKQ